MTSATDEADPADLGPATAQAPPWWRELGLVVGFYLIYTWIRNQFGSAAVSAEVAYDNAVTIIDIEKAMGLYFEAEVQSWFIDWEWFLRAWNIFYGTLHFLITIGGLLWIYLRRPAHYARWRTIGLSTTGFALIGFATFPLMPPRLLGNCRAVGACIEDSPFVDTMAEIGGIWSFDSGTMEAISNQYAAMPSLHFAWAMWSFLALRPHLPTWGRRAMATYPWLTVFAIVVTANHYWIDAVGGAVVLAAGLGVGRLVHGPDPHRGGGGGAGSSERTIAA